MGCFSDCRNWVLLYAIQVVEQNTLDSLAAGLFWRNGIAHGHDGAMG